MMTDTGTSVLFAKLPTPVYDRIRAAAGQDGRSITKWVEIHFREYFERVDQECDRSTSTSDSASDSSDSS